MLKWRSQFTHQTSPSVEGDFPVQGKFNHYKSVLISSGHPLLLRMRIVTITFQVLEIRLTSLQLPRTPLLAILKVGMLFVFFLSSGVYLNHHDIRKIKKEQS